MKIKMKNTNREIGIVIFCEDKVLLQSSLSYKEKVSDVKTRVYPIKDLDIRLPKSVPFGEEHKCQHYASELLFSKLGIISLPNNWLFGLAYSEKYKKEHLVSAIITYLFTGTLHEKVINDNISTGPVKVKDDLYIKYKLYSIKELEELFKNNLIDSDLFAFLYRIIETMKIARDIRSEQITREDEKTNCFTKLTDTINITVGDFNTFPGVRTSEIKSNGGRSEQCLYLYTAKLVFSFGLLPDGSYTDVIGKDEKPDNFELLTLTLHSDDHKELMKDLYVAAIETVLKHHQNLLEPEPNNGSAWIDIKQRKLDKYNLIKDEREQLMKHLHIWT